MKPLLVLRLALLYGLIALLTTNVASSAILSSNKIDQVGGQPTDTIPAGEPDTKRGREYDSATFKAEIDRLEAVYTNLANLHSKLAEPVEKALTNRPFVRSEVRELAFEKNHTEMLYQLRSSIELISTIEALNVTATKLVAELNALRGIPPGPSLAAYESLINKASAIQEKIQKDLSKLRDYKTTVNDTLIEDVHKYNLKISFRSLVGISWIAAFLLMVSVFCFLLWNGKLSIAPGSTMQFIAVILIIFVIILFGITDVMGENGVTGILAAIAGYILGKSGTDGTNNVAEIIRAARGEPAKQSNAPSEGE